VPSSGFEKLGMEVELRIKGISKMKSVGSDGVHLKKSWNRKAAVKVTCRLMNDEVGLIRGETESKKLRR
jgi:hypothetical protein